MAQLDLAVGDALLIGTKRFTIRGIIDAEPGRRLGAFSLGPRIFISRDALAQTKDFAGVTGTTTLDEHRNAVKPAVVLQIKDGKLEYIETITP